MAELGSGNGTDYPTTLDTDNVLEVDSPAVGKTKARADVPNDSNAAIVAIETELGTDPAGTTTDIKTFLQVEHDTDGTHGAITPTTVVASTSVSTDTINEKTAATGVTIDGVKLKDSEPYCDVINEKSADTGVTIDGFTIKDTAPDPTVWPSFATYVASNQAIGASTPVKVTFDTEEFDTNSDFDKDTNYRFTPTVAGKYLIISHLLIASMDTGAVSMHIYKNGSGIKDSSNVAATDVRQLTISTIVDMNGSSDYLEIYVDSATDTGYTVSGNSSLSGFAGSRIA